MTVSVDARAPPSSRSSTRSIREIGFEPTHRLDPVAMSGAPLAALREVLPGAPELVSGAGHDAMVLAAAGVPTAMLFVRSLNGGISHSPDELSSAEDIELAVEALTAALARLVAMTEREVMKWKELGQGTRALAELVADDGYRPDMILAIARGGLLVAGALSYALGVKNTFTMNVEFYTGVDERLELPMILPPVPDLVDFAGDAGPDRRRRRRHGRDPRARQGVLRRQGRGGALRRALREAALDRALRVRLAPDRPLDRLPLERSRPGRSARRLSPADDLCSSPRGGICSTTTPGTAGFEEERRE